VTTDDLYFKQLLVGPMENFVYLVGSKRTRECLIVDPAWDAKAIAELAEADGMTVAGALVTHYHPDHVGGGMMGFVVPGGLTALLEHRAVPIHVNKHEAEGLVRITGVSDTDLVKHDGGDVVTVGDVAITLVHTPGHTPGSQCFLVRDRLVAGDTLFLDGCGRVDLPGADPEAMYHSLTGTLAKVDDAVELFPGHNYGARPSAPMGEVKRSNYALKFPSLDAFLRRMG
jgi:hydroxyacylglutathione hydrolase